MRIKRGGNEEKGDKRGEGKTEKKRLERPDKGKKKKNKRGTNEEKER